jgi:hypothetical protein
VVIEVEPGSGGKESAEAESKAPSRGYRAARQPARPYGWPASGTGAGAQDR